MECDLAKLQEMFALMTRDGLDLSQPLKWGFFFMNAHPEPLRCVVQELQSHKYEVERLEPADDGTWVLAVSKVEVLPIDKLHRRNQGFNELAAQCGADLYDGWDVGPVGGGSMPDQSHRRSTVSDS
jgi:Regulator of ribonuclease activity B